MFRLLALMAAAGLLPLQIGAQTLYPLQPQTAPGLFSLGNLPKDGYVELSGTWDLWPNRFVPPIEADDSEAPMRIEVPSHWSSLEYPALSSTGYATYHARIANVPSDRILGLKITCPISAARVFADGVEILEIGRPGTSGAEESPRWDSQVIALPPNVDGMLDLDIQVSNHVDFSGGLTSPVLLGDYGAIAKIRNTAIEIEMFEVGALVIIGFYGFLAFAFRPKDRHALYLGILGLMFAARTLFYDEFVILALWPSLPFAVEFRFGYLTFAAPAAFLALFFKHLYPKNYPDWLARAAVSFSLLYSLFALIAPFHLVSVSLVWAELLVVVLGVLTLVFLTRVLVDGSPGSPLLALGFAAFFIPVVHDIMVITGYIRGILLAPFGLILFFITLAILISRDWATTKPDREIVYVAQSKPRLILSEKGLSSTETAYSLAALAGKSVKEIAGEYDVSESTVRNSLARVYGKLEVPNMAGFVALASKHEIVP